MLGSKKPPAQTVTIPDFHFEADSVAYTAYQFRDGEMSRIVTADLPPVIRGFNGDVIRRDLPDSIAIPFDTNVAK